MSDDVDAVSRLPILNETYFRNILCEMGGMFAIANRVDNIHRRPWIGFQSWRAASRKVFLMFDLTHYNSFSCQNIYFCVCVCFGATHNSFQNCFNF